MVNLAKTGRRWPRILLALLPLTVLVSIAWANRPLNAVEARLVGTWRAESARRNEIVFSSSRTWSRGGSSAMDRGDWSAAPGRLAMRQRAVPLASLAGVIGWLRYELNRDAATQTCSIEFEGADTFVIHENDPSHNLRFRRVGRATGL